jgi:hypothetical protein
VSEVQRYETHPISGRVAAAEIDAFHESTERLNGLRGLMRMAIQDFTEYDSAIDSAQCPALKARLVQVENAAFTEWRSLIQRYMRRGSGIKEESFEIKGRKREQSW